MGRVRNHRAHAFVAALLGGVSLGALAAHAQNATWQTVPTVAGPLAGTFDFNANANWTPAAVPTGTASFGATTGTNLSFSGTNTTLSGFTFNAGAPAYSFQFASACIGCIFPNLTFTGAGVVNNAATAPTFTMFLGTTLSFQNASTAANSNIVMRIGSLDFFNTSNAGNAVITMPDSLHPGFITFHNNSSAGSANITVTETSGAQITAELRFLDNSTAANATIFNNPGVVFDPSQPNAGRTEFGVLGGTDTASAGSAHITNNAQGGNTAFYALTSAQNATIVNNLDGGTSFRDNSTAANANITNNAGGFLFLAEQATLGNAVVTNSGNVQFGFGFNFGDTATAGNATIVNNSGGLIQFFDSTTAGNATITTNNGATVQFFQSSSGGTARFITNFGGTFDISGLTTAGMTAGSIEGAGSYILGSKALTVGGNNLSTEVSGVISGNGGALIKVGSGTLTLSGANTYTGGTTISAGVLQLGNGGTTGSITGNVTDNATLVFSRSNTVVYGGIISGTGAVVIQNTPFVGLTILTGDSTYTGGTTIASGTLVLGTGGTTGSIVGDIVNNGQLTFSRSNDVTFSGLISGSGALTKFGAATLTLTADNTYTNGTVIAAGTLQLGNGGPTGTIGSSTVNDGGILAFNRSNLLSFGAVISGTGAVEQNGPGTTNLTATNTYTGATTVNAGTLLVNGSIVSSSGVTVNAGGTLGGTGLLPSTTINPGGALAPGNSIGTITVSGSLTFVGAGNYIVEVSPATADRTNASGTATLSGTLHAVGLGGTYTIGTKYTVINAAGVVGTFGSLDVTGSFGATRPHIEYDANNVYLVLGQGTISPFLVGGTPNQRAVAGTIDTALLAGSQAAPFLALFNLSSAQLPSALDALSGEVHASTAGVLVDESRYMRQAVLGRLQQASYGPDMGAMAALSIGGPQAAFADGTELISALAYAKSPIVTKAQPMVAPSRDVVFWAQGFGAWGRFETDGNATTVRRDLAGFISGVDTRVANDGRLGLAAGYTSSRNVLDGRGSANVETGHVAAYGGWRFGSISLRAGGAYAFHTIDTDRSIAFPGFFDRATAHYEGGTGQVFGEIGYGIALANIAVEPFAGAAWVRLNTDAAAERGGPAALNVAGTTFEVGYSTLGIRAASMIPIAHDMMLIPRGTLAWQHAFDSVTPIATLAFQAAPVPFVIAGVPIARDALLAEAGLDLAIGRHATLGVSYVGQLAGNVQDHAAKGKFSWKF
jgi:outer membrane autotransporter protein